MTAWSWLVVAVVGGAGSVARMAGTVAIGRNRPPLGTLAINLSGAFALGVLAGAGAHGNVRLFAGTALLGAFTTFSTLMHEAFALKSEGRRRDAAVLLAISAAGGLAAVAAGHAIGSAF